MTKAQIRKLETILAKLESLQGEVDNPTANHKLGVAKGELLKVLREAEKGR